MRIIIIFILISFSISCSDKKNESEFDKVLGKENIETLDFLVSDFENDFLKRQYANLDTENAYRQFLTELRDDKIENWKEISQKARHKFDSSDLRLEMYEFPDSVWVLKNSSFDKIESDSLPFLESPVPYVKSRFKYKNPDGTIEYTYSRGGGQIKITDNFDSIVKSELKRPRFNFIGSYLMAIKSVSKESEFLNEFYGIKNGVGIISPQLTAKVMLEKNVDLNNPTIRKIIVLEMAY